MSGSHDVVFPIAIAFGATGGPERANEIVGLRSGREVRNQRRAHARRRYDAGTGIRSITDVEEITAFFEARRGSLHAFRFRDPFDWKSCTLTLDPSALDQTIGIGDGSTANFQLTKTYGNSPDGYARPIARPVADTVKVSVAGSELVAGAGFTVNSQTGIVSLTTPPASGDVITAGYEFDVPVRFDTDHLAVSMSGFKAGQIPAIPLIEVLP